MPNEEPITLATIGGGALEELFEHELEKVLCNIQDPNTKADAVRGLTIKMKIKPNDERNIGQVAFEVDCKLAPFEGFGTQVFIGHLHGQIRAVENDPGQMQLKWDEESRPTMVPANGDQED